MAKRIRHPSPPLGPKITFWVVLYQHFGKLCGTVLLIYIFSRANTTDMPTMFDTLMHSGLFEIAGWVVAAFILLLGIGAVMITRNIYKPEIARLAAERDNLQAALIGKGVQHSDDN
jgi:hypothetical protein